MPEDSDNKESIEYPFNHLPYVLTFTFYTIRDDFRDFLNTAAEHILKRTPLVDNKWMRLMNARFISHQSLHQRINPSNQLRKFLKVPAKQGSGNGECNRGPQCGEELHQRYDDWDERLQAPRLPSHQEGQTSGLDAIDF